MMNTGRCNCGCNRMGERIVVNNGGCGCGCGCGNHRCGATCANTYRPSNHCGCVNHHPYDQRCECRRPCPRPCPKPCPSCEDRCRMQYRECMKECRCREDENRCCCGRPNNGGCRHTLCDDNRCDED